MRRILVDVVATRKGNDFGEERFAANGIERIQIVALTPGNDEHRRPGLALDGTPDRVEFTPDPRTQGVGFVAYAEGVADGSGEVGRARRLEMMGRAVGPMRVSRNPRYV